MWRELFTRATLPYTQLQPAIDPEWAHSSRQIPAFPRPLKSVLGRRARLLDRAAADLAAALSGVIHVSSQFELDEEFFCADGFHPSQMGYAVWGERLAEAIVRA